MTKTVQIFAIAIVAVASIALGAASEKQS